MKKTVFKLSVIPAAVFSTGLATAATPDEIIDSSFYPSKKGVPTHPVVKPGAVINKSNVDSAKDVLAAMYQVIKNGDYEITVGATTSFDLHKSYVVATRARFGKGHSPGPMLTLPLGTRVVLAPEEPKQGDTGKPDRLAGRLHLTELGVTEEAVELDE